MKKHVVRNALSLIIIITVFISCKRNVNSTNRNIESDCKINSNCCIKCPNGHKNELDNINDIDNINYIEIKCDKCNYKLEKALFNIGTWRSEIEYSDIPEDIRIVVDSYRKRYKSNCEYQIEFSYEDIDKMNPKYIINFKNSIVINEEEIGNIIKGHKDDVTNKFNESSKYNLERTKIESPFFIIFFISTKASRTRGVLVNYIKKNKGIYLQIIAKYG